MATAPKKNGTTKKATTPRAPKAEVPANIRKLIVEKIDGGMGVTAVAKQLDERQQAKGDTGRDGWYGKAVWNIYKAETGRNPGDRQLASKAVAKNPPAATTKLDPLPKKKATPLPKKAQASGTSRGGTGAKKKSTAAAAKARTTAKRSGTARKPAARKAASQKR